MEQERTDVEALKAALLPQEQSMPMRARMATAFGVAFAEWDRRCIDDADYPESPADRGAYFANLLDELAAGRPWVEIADQPGGPR